MAANNRLEKDHECLQTCHRRKRRHKRKGKETIEPEVVQPSLGCEGSKRGLSSQNEITSLQRKLDTNAFECRLENLWNSLPDEKRNSFAYLDCLWFSLYLKASSKSKVLSWIKKKKIFSKKYVVVPIIKWHHWSLLILCHMGESLLSKPTAPCMLLLDSLQLLNPERLEPGIRKFILDLYKVEGRPVSKKQIYQIPLKIPKVPQQRNGEDCGNFVLYYINLFMESAPENFSLSEGYPYFMKDDWFTHESLDRFCGRMHVDSHNSRMDSPPGSEVSNWTGDGQTSTTKAHWDPKSNEAFIRLCVDQVRAGNRPRTYLSKQGWENVAKELAAKTGKYYSHSQLKNKWDVLKREWLRWIDLLRGENGLSQKPSNGAIDAADDWWEAKLHCYQGAAKFRYQPLQCEDDMAVLFSDVAASREFASTPNSRVVPNAESIRDNCTPPDDINLDDNDEIQLEEFSTPIAGVKRLATLAPKKQATHKRVMSRGLAKALNHIVDACEPSSFAPAQVGPKLQVAPTIEECLDKLSSMESYKDENDIRKLATRLFKNPNTRTLFMVFPDEDKRKIWFDCAIAVERAKFPPMF